MNPNPLRIVIGLLGLVPIYIGATGVFSGLDGLLPGAQIDARADGQYRYLAAIYLGFGGLLVWIQSRFEQEFDLFRILMAIVFIAGAARAIAIAVHGLPQFTVLLATAFELIAPPAFVAWHSKVVHRKPTGS